MTGTLQRGREALIVGGGLAGATLGILLARQGRDVEILEQSAGMHHKVCGEFLSGEAVEYLERLGVSPRSLGAVTMHGVRLHARGLLAACELPFPAMSLTRRALDEALLSLAERAGAVVSRGRRVDRLMRDEDSWRATLLSAEAVTAPAAFLATGKHDLAGHRRPAGRQNSLVAFKMYFRLLPEQERALSGWVELFLFPGGYAGLQMVEDNQANLCLVVERSRLERCGRDWPRLLAHMLRCSTALAERLDGAEPLLPKPLALSSIPYGLLMQPAQDGLWRLGDQAAVIPSFSGDGMSIALHSAHLAAEMYMRGGTAAEYARKLRRELRPAVQLATMFSRLMVRAPVLAQAVRLWPGVLAHCASHTRVPEEALLMETFQLRRRGAEPW
ncbi:MAG: FAD-dependent monooxygenase [Acidobacteriota bacterium]|nr:FAD-dependent monooxygenase [Acidobacteriota bacterium]